MSLFQASTCFEHMCSSSGGQNCTIQSLVSSNLFYNEFISCLYMFRKQVLIVRRAKLYYTVSGIITPIGGLPVHGTATYRCDDTRDSIIQFLPS